MVSQLAFVRCVATIVFLHSVFRFELSAQVFAFLALGACWHCCKAASRMGPLIWPPGVPRFCSFRLGDVRGCGAKVSYLNALGVRLRYRFCCFNEWMMCPACYGNLPNLSDDDPAWRLEVLKDEGDNAGPSSGSTGLSGSSKVKKVLKKPASK
jgi:hypothetical protein